MATTISTLSAADQADFTKRLSAYGLDASAVIQSDLVVPPKSTMTLSANDPKSFVQPHVLTTSDLDELKTWIGIPDTLYQTGKLDRAKTVLPRAAVPVAKLPITTTIKAPQLDDIHAGASAYLFGDSTLVASYKPTVEQYFKNFQIIFWPFLTITVNAGSVLTIGPGQNVLSAWKIIVDPGGMVYAPYGRLKVDSTILQVS
jgi:hypothetical protein